MIATRPGAASAPQNEYVRRRKYCLEIFRVRKKLQTSANAARRTAMSTLSAYLAVPVVVRRGEPSCLFERAKEPNRGKWVSSLAARSSHLSRSSKPRSGRSSRRLALRVEVGEQIGAFVISGPRRAPSDHLLAAAHPVAGTPRAASDVSQIFAFAPATSYLELDAFGRGRPRPTRTSVAQPINVLAA